MTESTNDTRPGLPSDPMELLAGVLTERGWDTRDGQVQMVTHIGGPDHQGLPESAVSAPVGTGKTLGYLCGALPWARRIVIATSTKALQTQIISKELPELAENLKSLYGYDLTFMSLKGKANYIDLTKTARMLSAHGGEVVEEAEPSLGLDDDGDDGDYSERDWSILADAFARTKDALEEGTLADLDQDELLASLPPRMRAAACVDRYSTETAKKWPSPSEDNTYQKVIDRSKCAYRTAYANAMNVDILVVNIALLAAEVVKANSSLSAPDAPKLLPETDIIIIDEAHHATNRFVDALRIEHDVHKFERQTVKFLDKMVRAGLTSELKSSMETKISDYVDEIVSLADTGNLTRTKLRDNASGLADNMIEFMAAGKATSSNKSLSTMLDIFRNEFVRELSEVSSNANLKNYGEDYTHLVSINWRSAADANVSFEDDTPTISLVPIDLTGTARQMVAATRDIQRYVHSPEEHADGIAELSGKGFLSMCSGTIARDAPSDIGMTRVKYKEVDSPFSPHAQKLYLTRYLPTPSGKTQEDWMREGWKEAKKGIEAIDGRTLFLCTSFKSLRYFRDRAQAELVDRTVLAQDRTADKQELISRFVDDERSILFGTMASFGEGVDIPGSSLSMVVVDKINFPIPNDPIHRSRVESAKRRNKSDFGVSIDAAAVMMAQVAGRLIRSDKCAGGIMVLDPRVTTKKYGSSVMKLLPQESEWTDKLTTFTNYMQAHRDRIESEQEANPVRMGGQWKPLSAL